MADRRKESQRTYAELTEHAERRSKELAPMLQPYIEVTDRYGELVCHIALALGQTPPSNKRDVVLRDLMADVFDFLYEGRNLVIKGKLEIAYPLARRAYESLSLMVACFQHPPIADRWSAGKKINNSEVRKLLAEHPAGEPEHMTEELYKFFSEASHPNRDLVAHRFLGDGNEFVLGSIGRPNLTMLADYALKTLDLWYWFGAFSSFVYLPVLAKDDDPSIMASYQVAEKKAKEVMPWLVEQFDRLLAEDQEELEGRMKADQP